MQRFIINPPVFIGAVALTGLFVAVGAFLPGQAEVIFAAVQGWTLASFTSSWTAAEDRRSSHSPMAGLPRRTIGSPRWSWSLHPRT